MSAFRPGWYEVGFDASTRDRRRWYFKDSSAYTAECLLKSIRELHVNFSGRPLWLAVGSAQMEAGGWP